MATIKSFTSLEQSKKLAEILPLESADMYWYLATKGNHPEDLLKKVQETCDELKVFKMDSKDCFVADVGTDDGKIVEFFNVLLAKIKKYRETDCPK